MNDEETGMVILFLVVFCATLALLIGLGFYQAMAREKCLEMGFPKYTMTWNFRTFCLGYDGVMHPVVKEAK